MKNKTVAIGLCVVLLLTIFSSGCMESTDEGGQKSSESESKITGLEAQIASLQNNYTMLQNQYNELLTEYNTLVGQYNSLKKNYSNLENQYDSLQEQYNTLQTQYNTLLSQYNMLQNNYSNLQSDYTTLQEQYNTLWQQYNITKALRIGHLLEDFYEEERDMHEGFLWWLFNGGEQGAVDFAANMASHDLGKNSFPTQETTFYSLSYQHSYVIAREKLGDIMDFTGINPTDDSTMKIKKILEFIDTYITYESDMNEAFLSPIETLAFGSEDCDGFAILASAMFEYVGIDSAVAFFDSPDYPNSGHAMTLVHLTDLGSYSCYSYSDLTSKGLQSGKWIIIEPQSTIEYQHTSWVASWNIRVASEVCGDKDFDGTIDDNDLDPEHNIKIKITIKSYKVYDTVDSGESTADVYFHAKINSVDYFTTTAYNVPLNSLQTVNISMTCDVPDDKSSISIEYNMWDDDGYHDADVWHDDIIDIDGHDTSSGLTLTYYITSGTWSGDDNDGFATGNQTPKGYVEYTITTVYL